MDSVPIVLSNILTDTFPGLVSFLSGKADEPAFVNWVSLSLEEAEQGDLLLLPSQMFTSNVYDKSRAIKLSGIVLLGKQPPFIPKKVSTPIILINTDISVGKAHRSIIDFIFAEKTTINEKRLYIHQRLARLAADGAQLDGLAHIMLEITRRGIIIQDKRLNIIAESTPPDFEDSWLNISEQFSQVQSLPDSLSDRKKAGKHNITLLQDISGGISRIITPIIVNNVARGYLSLIGLQGTMDNLDRLVAEEGALICAMVMARSKAVRETEKKLQSDLLTALLQEDLSPRDAALWIQAMGLDQDQAHVAMQFAWDAPNPPSRRRLETLINGEIIQSGAIAIINPAEKNVICFCQVPNGDKRPQIPIELGTRVLDQAKQEYPKMHVRCGIGSAAINLNQWYFSFREAGLALEMAIRLSKDDPQYYPDLLVNRLLLLLEHNPELLMFKEDIIGELLKQDKKNDLVITLESYFENNTNLSKTAEAMFIHRNTLAYRIEKIIEITGWDLNNPETALAVQIALKIHRMIR